MPFVSHKTFSKRRKESDTYLATFRRHRRAFSQHCGFHQLKRKTLQLMKPTVLAESSNKLSFFIIISALHRCLRKVAR